MSNIDHTYVEAMSKMNFSSVQALLILFDLSLQVGNVNVKTKVYVVKWVSAKLTAYDLFLFNYQRVYLAAMVYKSSFQLL